MRSQQGKMAAVVLAAGRGERMGGDGPKVLEPILGKPMLDWVLARIDEAGIKSSFVIIGYQGERVREHFRERRRVCCIRQARQLGTADAVRTALPYLAGYNEILVLCGDTPLFRTESLRLLIREHRLQRNAATFLSAEIPDPTGYGRVIRKNGQVTAIVEEKSASGAERQIREVNTGAYVFQKKGLAEMIRSLSANSIGEFYLTDLIHLWAEQGLSVNAIKLADYNEGWGVNSPDEWIRAAVILKNRILDRYRRQGVTIIDPATTCVSEGVRIGKGTTVYPFTMIESDVTVGEKCHIGPFAHLRPGSQVQAQAEIGNFVEVTRTRIGKKTKAKHLSYLGDAQIGDYVNIGAGTITANYDGKQKHKTVIEDNVMIGSHTTLVAPVRVGKRAITGAGCVVLKRKNVPPRAVVVGVPARVLKNSERSENVTH